MEFMVSHNSVRLFLRNKSVQRGSGVIVHFKFQESFSVCVRVKIEDERLA